MRQRGEGRDADGAFPSERGDPCGIVLTDDVERACELFDDHLLGRDTVALL